MDMISEFLDHLIKNNWVFHPRQLDEAVQPKILIERYGILAAVYVNFLNKFKLLTNKADNVWFLSIEDFEERAEAAFKWNEFEMQSLESCGNDKSLIEEVKNFWNNHLPIALSVRGHYSYLAISFLSSQNGKIVFGEEPEYEHTTIVSETFLDFLLMVINSPNEINFSVKRDFF